MLALACAACRVGPSEVGAWNDADAYRWRDLPALRGGGPGFSQRPPSATGIEFTNEVGRALMRQNRHLVQGSGVAVGDMDGDGWADIYLARIDGPNALYRNLGNWRFEEVAVERGVGAPDRFSTGAAFADVDGDRDLDLLVTALGGPNALFLNDGSGHFTELTAEAGLSSDRGSTTMALADVDGDGDLDLYVANYKVVTALDLFPPQERAFDQVVQRAGAEFRVAPMFEPHYRVQVRPDLGVVVRTQRADPDWFYLNDGQGRFQRVPLTAGRFRTAGGAVLQEEPELFSLVASFRDLDGDGDPDLYVCNDFEDPDELWINDGTGTFRAAPATALRNTSNSSMAVDFSDVDRDGRVDVFVADMLSRDPVRRKTQTPTHTPLPKLIGRILDRPQMQRNTLALNRGDGTFQDISSFAGVEASDWSWATLFLDVDLDGYEDLLVATGHTWDVMDADTEERLQTSRTRVNWRDERFLFPSLPLRNVAFRNQGDLTFREVGREWGFANEEDISHGIAAGDLDNDGDLDLVINRLGSPAGIFRNDATAPRVAVRLIGRSPNTQGVGAKIRLRGGPVPVQEKEVTLGGLYLSSSDPTYAFATGDQVDMSLEVVWRSGARTVVPGVRPNRQYEIREDSVHASPTAPRESTERPAPYFTDVSDGLRHVHVEAPFDDFGRQPLLPYSLSQLGPGVAWSDVDRDGDEDLLITSGRGGRLSLFRNERGRLVPASLPAGVATLDQTTVLAMPDGKGGTALLLGQMNYEAESPAAARAADAVIRLDLGAGARASTAVPGSESSTGPLALADYDADGDLDLFVGGRVLPARYPAPASSRLFGSQGGRFVPDTVNHELLSEIGLVSAAVFSDIDGDGDPDLLLALEWGPIKVLVNEGGRFSDATSALGLDRFSSRWNGITTGDFNEDGLPDIVATSWGRNTRLRPDSAHPVMVYYADFDGNGTMDVVEAQYDARLKAVAPLRGFLGLTLGIPDVGRRIGSFRAYADASVRDVLGPAATGASVLQMNGLAHTLFLSRDGGFDAVELPGEAQLAPAFYAGVADFNGDGHDDLFLTQNFFSTEVGTRYDAGRGLWLSGDGRGGLTPVAGGVSGVKVYGDQRGAALADFDADGRVDLVVSQNANRTVLYRNRGGKPGLRVRLIGTPENPHAFGATLRLVYGGERGPGREVHAGSGYWSQDGPVQVLGMRQQPTAVWVRWPDGGEATVAVPEGARELVVTAAAR